MKIIKELESEPMNANQLTKNLGIDYKTTRHHLKVLVQNKMVMKEGGKYGETYRISGILEEHRQIFEEIWEKVNKSEKGKKV